MKTILLVAGGRGGSDFFQGLLDGHSQILSFPLYLRIDQNFVSLLKINDKLELVKKFIKLFPEFFNSKINKFERHHKLGKNKNKHFSVNTKVFEKNFIKMTKKKNLSNFEKIKYLHIAYSATKGENIKLKKILFIHTHLVSWTKKFIKEVNPKNTEIVHIIRHPFASLSSPIKNWLRYKGGESFFPKDLFFQIDLVFNGIFDLIKLKKVRVIRYESLHQNFNKVMKDFCRVYSLKFEKTLKSCTKNGYLWWGDSVSKKWLKGINKNFKISYEKDIFFKRDLYFFQFLNQKIIKEYNYSFFIEKKKIFFNFLPMKCELLVWKNTFKHLIFNFRWKHFFSIPFFYFLRIAKINYFMINKNKLPYTFGN